MCISAAAQLLGLAQDSPAHTTARQPPTTAPGVRAVHNSKAAAAGDSPLLQVSILIRALAKAEALALATVSLTFATKSEADRPFWEHTLV